MLVLIFGLIGWTGLWSFRHFMAEAYCNTVPNSTLNRDQNPPMEEIVKAIEWDPGNAEYWYKLGNRQMSEPQRSVEAGGGRRSEVRNRKRCLAQRRKGAKRGKTEGGRRRTEIGGQRSEVGNRNRRKSA